MYILLYNRCFQVGYFKCLFVSCLLIYTQGYLEKKLAVESVKKLIKKTKGIIEENMKKIEFVDSLVSDVFNFRLFML